MTVKHNAKPIRRPRKKRSQGANRKLVSKKKNVMKENNPMRSDDLEIVDTDSLGGHSVLPQAGEPDCCGTCRYYFYGACRNKKSLFCLGRVLHNTQACTHYAPLSQVEYPKS